MSDQRPRRVPGTDAKPSRDESLAARERLSQMREETADLRDTVAQLRDQEVRLREAAALSREQLIEEAESIKGALEANMLRLRDANEHLVVSSVHAQTMLDETHRAKDRMAHIAHHDFLTDLPNRVLLQERLIQAIALAKRHREKLAVLFMDLDRFKTINDTLGHAVGDKLLQAVAQRLTASVRNVDTVGRQGGDEFIVLLSEVVDERDVAHFAEKLQRVVSAPYAIDGQELQIGLSVGIAMYPDDGQDAETLLLNADVAMYNAKQSGRGRYHFFRADMNARAVERQRRESELLHALVQREFELYYQPELDLETKDIIGFEALVRWRHPTEGLLLPEHFLPIANACGAIVPIGRWVLHEACRQAVAWQKEGLPLQVVSVNVSAVEFGKEDFFSHVRSVLLETGLAPHHLELELTESVLMENSECAANVLQGLKAMGVRIAIDDFGIGYSSLSYLKQFPVDRLKIDRSFVAGIARNGEDAILLRSMIYLGKGLRHRVTAEGIETREQLAFLREQHCPEGQGYYLSPPMIAEEFSALLRRGVSPELFPTSSAAH